MLVICNRCGHFCKPSQVDGYTCQIVEVITKVMFDNEDGEQVEYLN